MMDGPNNTVLRIRSPEIIVESQIYLLLISS